MTIIFGEKTGVLIFMWQIKIGTYRKLSVWTRQHIKLAIFLTSSVDTGLKSFVFKFKLKLLV